MILKNDEVGDVPQGRERFADRIGENEAGFHQLDPQRLGEKLPSVFRSLDRAGESVDERRVQMHDVGERQQSVEQRFHGRPGGLAFKAGGHHHVQHFRFPLRIIA